MNILNIEDLNYHSAPDPATSGHNFIVTIFFCVFHQIIINFSIVEKLYFWNLVDFLRNLFPKRVKKRTIIAHQQYRSTDDLYYVS